MVKNQPIFSEVFSYDNIVRSAEKCLQKVMWKSSTQMFRINLLSHCVMLHEQIINHTYISKGFTEFVIKERGKLRHIKSVHISERVVQKTLCEYGLKPILLPSLIYDNSASISGKGQDFMILRLTEHLRWHYARYGLQGGILICDIHDYFHSIDHDILLNKLRKAIVDDEIYSISKYFISCFGKGNGLGLGSEISQICAVFYLNDLDHTIKEKYHIHGYGRYNDDFYIISKDVDKLKIILGAVEQICSGLNLSLNSKHTQIYKFSDKPVFTILKHRISITDKGAILKRPVHENVKNRRKQIRLHHRLYTEGKIDYAYACKSLNIWGKGMMKRKHCYQTIKSTKKYFNNLFKDEVMNEKVYQKNIDKIEKQLYFIEKHNHDVDERIEYLYYKANEIDKKLTNIIAVISKP